MQVNKVIIVSSIVCWKSSGSHLSVSDDEVKNLLKDPCVINGFTFIDNGNFNNSDYMWWYLQIFAILKYSGRRSILAIY